MAQNNVNNANTNNSNILSHWGFIAFAQQFGTRIAAGPCTNSYDGTSFPAATFTKDGQRTFAKFGPSLAGGLTAQEMIERRQQLQVLQLRVKPETLAKRREKGLQEETYVVCLKGESSWDEVDLADYL